MIPRKKIVIVTGSHLRFNPRVWKEANCLSEAGYDVEIFTTLFSSNYWKEDLQLIKSDIKYNPSFSLIIDFKRIVPVIMSKIIRRFANIIFHYLNISSIYQLIYSPKKQLTILKSSSADLFICHQEVGLLLGTKLLVSGYKVAFDFEDWYSEDYLNPKRPVTLLKDAEYFAMNNALFVLCPSQTMSEVLSKTYGSNKIVDVIYNCFQFKYNHKVKSHKIPNSFVWFSQTIGPNRGLENFLISIKNLVTPIEIHLIGNCSNDFKLILLSLQKECTYKLIFHSLMNHFDLMNFIQQFHFGLALENSTPPNKNLTISNKLLLYLQLNLNIIATSTCGHLEIQKDFYNKIFYLDYDKEFDFAKTLDNILCSNNVSTVYEVPLNYTWEFQEKKLLTLVNEAIRK